MKVQLNRQNDAVHFVATDEFGREVSMDGSPAAGGRDLGFRPMSMILMGLGGCSAIDIVLILEKMKQPVGDIRIEIEGIRDPKAVPSVFTSIEVHYFVSPKSGEVLDEDKVSRAVSLSVEKYCSVTRMLESTVDITHRFTIE
jgi:putative redox protein